MVGTKKKRKRWERRRRGKDNVEVLIIRKKVKQVDMVSTKTKKTQKKKKKKGKQRERDYGNENETESEHENMIESELENENENENENEDMIESEQENENENEKICQISSTKSTQALEVQNEEDGEVEESHDFLFFDQPRKAEERNENDEHDDVYDSTREGLVEEETSTTTGRKRPEANLHIDLGQSLNRVLLELLGKSSGASGNLDFKPVPTHFDSVSDALSCFRPLIVEEASQAVQNEWVHMRRTLNERRKIVTGQAMQVEVVLVTPNEKERMLTVKLSIKSSRRNLKARIFNTSNAFLIKVEDAHILGFVNAQSRTTATGDLVLDVHRSWRGVLSRHVGRQCLCTAGPGLVSFARMYSVKVKEQRLGFEHILLRGAQRIHHIFDSDDSDSDSRDSEHADWQTASGTFKMLNPSQKKAVKDVMEASMPSLHLWQGPPGSGKTRTIISLLEAFLVQASSHQTIGKVLAAGPSNQSVQVLLEGFLSMCKNANHPVPPVALIGVEEMIPDHLFPYFVHRTIESTITKLEALARNLVGEETCMETATMAFKPCAACDGNEMLNDNDEEEVDENVEKACHEALDLLQLFMKRMPSTWKSCKLSSQRGRLRTGIHKECVAHALVQITHVLGEEVLRNETARFRAETEFVQSAKFVFCTLAVAGRNSVARALKHDRGVELTIVDEACQSVEAETWLSLQCYPKHLLLVGDPAQLRATVTSQKAAHCKFDRPLMERLMACGVPHKLLNIQYRMHPAISLFPRHQFYGGLLHDDDSVVNRAILQPSSSWLQPCVMFDVRGELEVHGRQPSFANVSEAKFILTLLRRLASSGVNVGQQVIIITFYANQVELIKSMVKQSGLPTVPVSTVDSFQGSEAEVVILSFVRANKKGNVGFLTDERRLNVALTRAKRSLLMVGHCETLQNSTSTMRALVESLRQRNLLERAIPS